MAISLGSPTQRASAFDGAITAELSQVMTGSDGQILVPGVLGDDLYLWGNPNHAYSSLNGIRRLKKGASAWEMLTTNVQDGVHTFSGGKNWGAVEFRGKLYCGDHAAGKLFRLDLNGDGSFNAIHDFGSTFCGNEDVHPGLVAWGQLWLATFGSGTGAVPNPGLWRWDGSAGSATNVVNSSFVGAAGLCDSMVMAPDGRIWATFSKPGKFELWAVASDYSTELLMQSTTQLWTLTRWGPDLIGSRTDLGTELFVYRDGAFLPITTGAVAGGGSAVHAVGDELFYFDNGGGPQVYRYDGKLTALSIPDNGIGHFAPTVWNGALWWTSTSGTASLYKLPIGTDRSVKQLARSQTTQGGSIPPRGLVSDSATNGIVLKSANGHYWRVTVGNTGTISTADLGTTRPGV